MAACLTPGLALSGNTFANCQAVHTSTSSTSHEAVMPCSWEGNRRSGVAAAMHNRLQCTPLYGLTAYEREISTPSSSFGMALFTLTGTWDQNMNYTKGQLPQRVCACMLSVKMVLTAAEQYAYKNPV